MNEKTVKSVSARESWDGDYRITVRLTPLELRLLRRAIAKATDEKLIGWNQGLCRVAELELLHLNALDDERRHLDLVEMRA